MKILVAEDDAFLRKVYAEKLSAAGFDVSTAEDGEQAIERLKKGGFDLVLLDILMPKKDGFAVLKERQHDANIQKVRVVMLSSLGQESDLEQAKKLGADDYYLKSTINLDELVQKVSGMSPEKIIQDRKLLIPAFVNDAKVSLAGIEDALEILKTNASDPQAQFEVMRLFHSLKSAAGFMGLNPLSERCKDIEGKFRVIIDGKKSVDEDLRMSAKTAVNLIDQELGTL